MQAIAVNVGFMVWGEHWGIMAHWGILRSYTACEASA